MYKVEEYSGEVHDDGLNEERQETSIKYQVVKKVDGVYVPIHPLAKCKDYLNDIIYCNYTGDLYYPIYGLCYDAYEYPMDKDKFRIAFRGVEIKYIKSKFHLITEFNKEVGMSVPEIEDVMFYDGVEGIVITSDVRWQENNFRMSLYYSFIRSCALRDLEDSLDTLTLEDLISNQVGLLGGLRYVASNLLKWTDGLGSNEGVGDVFDPEEEGYTEDDDEYYEISNGLWSNTMVHDYGFNTIIDDLFKSGRSKLQDRILEDSFNGVDIPVLVYGTLKKDSCNNVVLQDLNARLVAGLTHIYGWKMYNTGLGYPGAINTGSYHNHITGEIWMVDKDALEELDRFEVVASLYIRKTVSTNFGDKYIYEYNKPTKGMPSIESGRWNDNLHR